MIYVVQQRLPEALHDTTEVHKVHVVISDDEHNELVTLCGIPMSLSRHPWWIDKYCEDIQPDCNKCRDALQNYIEDQNTQLSETRGKEEE